MMTMIVDDNDDDNDDALLSHLTEFRILSNTLCKYLDVCAIVLHDWKYEKNIFKPFHFQNFQV